MDNLHKLEEKNCQNSNSISGSHQKGARGGQAEGGGGARKMRSGSAEKEVRGDSNLTIIQIYMFSLISLDNKKRKQESRSWRLKWSWTRRAFGNRRPKRRRKGLRLSWRRRKAKHNRSSLKSRSARPHFEEIYTVKSSEAQAGAGTGTAEEGTPRARTEGSRSAQGAWTGPSGFCQGCGRTRHAFI